MVLIKGKGQNDDLDSLFLGCLIVKGTSKVIDFVTPRRTNRFLYVFSGVVYGYVSEEDFLSKAVETALDIFSAHSIYDNAKWSIKNMFILKAHHGCFDCSDSRFYFVGQDVPSSKILNYLAF